MPRSAALNGMSEKRRSALYLEPALEAAIIARGSAEVRKIAERVENRLASRYARFAASVRAWVCAAQGKAGPAPSPSPVADAIFHCWQASPAHSAGGGGPALLQHNSHNRIGKALGPGRVPG